MSVNFRRSIRMKLFTYMLSTILIFAVLLLGFNTFFAEKYYIHHKKNTLMTISKELEAYIEDYGQESGKEKDREFFNETSLVNKINSLEKKLGGTIVIGNGRGEVYYPAQNMHGGMIAGPVHYDMRIPPHGKFEEWKRQDKNSFFMITKDPGYDINTLRYQIQREDGLILLIWVPMAEISENASLSNRFTFFIGLFTVLLTAVLTLLISGKFTKPIKEMNDITGRMSRLDFSKTLRIHTKDELGELSQSINELSYALGEAIGKLSQDIDRERHMEKLRREFVANVSHELKTPVFLIQGYAEGLKANIADNAERRDFYCNVIMEETDKMDALIKELLDLSRLEQEGFTVEKESFDFSEDLKEQLTKYQKVLKEKGLCLKTDIQEGVVIDADRQRSGQVITNFVMNAINYADEKRQLKVSLMQVTCKGKAVLSVYNSSPPIPEEEFPRLWQSFYKLNQARTREDTGTGLGLSIVRAIQESQGFSYGVYNTEGGVVFWCDFELGTKN